MKKKQNYWNCKLQNFMSSYYSISSEDRSWVYRNLSNHMADHSPRFFNEDSARKMILSFSFELKQKNYIMTTSSTYILSLVS